MYEHVVSAHVRLADQGRLAAGFPGLFRRKVGTRLVRHPGIPQGPFWLLGCVCTFAEASQAQWPKARKTMMNDR